MKVRSTGVILAVCLATAGRPAAFAQGVVAPAPGPVALSTAPEGPAPAAVVTLQIGGPALPGPAAAAPQTQNVFCSGSGESVPRADSPPTKQRFPLEVSWDNGLHFESADNQFSLHIG